MVRVVLVVLLLTALVNCSSHSSFLEPFRQAVAKNGVEISIDNRIQMTVTPGAITNEAGWVTVSWSGVSSPSKDDVVALYSPAITKDFSKVSPVKYQDATKSKDYLHTGKGSLRFYVINMHSNVVFVLLRMSGNGNTLLASSNAVSFSNYDAPLQPHIALTGLPNEMRVMWTTGSANNTQWLKWGTKSGVYTGKVKALSYTYTANELCGSPAKDFGWKDPGMLHTAVISGLTPFQRYYYVYGNDETSGWGPEGNFKAPPLPGDRTEVMLAAYGDMGKGEIDGSKEHWEERPSLNTTANVLALIDQLDLVLHIGDIAYAVGYSAQWDEFMKQIAPIASRVPYMTCPGNHEADYVHSDSYFQNHDSGGECGVPFFSRFLMPGQHTGTYWYSFDYGMIHFVMMSTEHDFTANSDQHKFIQQDLAAVNRTRTPWVIFSGHRPMYIDSTSRDGPDSDQVVAKLLRKNIEPLLVKYRVNLAFWGHHHSYQRTCPVNNEKCQHDPHFPVHVVIGMAGMGLSQNLEDKKPDWSVYVDDKEYGYSTMHITSTKLHFQFFSNTGGLRDQFELHQ